MTTAYQMHRAPSSGLPIAADRRAVALWLHLVALMVLAMAVIGAITRLTESGLSMVEWRPLIGWLPPLSEAEWTRVFDLYRQTPEYIHRNAGMELAGFKEIFFWEWFHRLWGRLIGVVFAGGFLWLLATRRLDRKMVPGLVALFALGAFQGFLGWFMVASGLVDRPSVSHYRLAMHLGTAILLYAVLLWVAVGLSSEEARSRGPEERLVARRTALVLGLVAVTILWGAFVAGLDAGLVYNDFPLMNGYVVPPEAFAIEPLWLNLFENTALVQFIHRCLAIITLAAVTMLAASVWRAAIETGARRVLVAAGCMGWVQVALGIATLVTAVPVWLGAAHQAGALVLVGLLVVGLRKLR